jgi:hypothetical protein
MHCACIKNNMCVIALTECVRAIGLISQKDDLQVQTSVG